MCWPFNTYVQPGVNYTGDFQAQDDVLSGLGWDVVNSTLQLYTTADMSSTLPVSIVVGTLLSNFFVVEVDIRAFLGMCGKGKHSCNETFKQIQAWQRHASQVA